MEIVKLLLAHPKIEIRSEAFYNCHKLTEITLPSTITYIGKCAFKFCISLKEIAIPQEESTNIDPWGSQRLNYQPENIHGKIHG